jgi:hypothetical protein
MAFEKKPNRGAMWNNDKKSAVKHPDMRGHVYLDRTFLLNLMHKNSDPLIKVSLSSWEEVSAAGVKYLSLSASEPWEGGQAAPKQVVPDDEIPY